VAAASVPPYGCWKQPPQVRAKISAAMKLVVLVKEVPSTEAKIELRDGKPDVSAVQMVLNPYDEYAIEEALKTAEANPGSTTTAVMAGSEASKKNLTNVLALGVDDAILINDAALLASGPLAVARALAAAIKPLAADAIFAGRQGVDFDWGLTAIAVAQELGIAHVGLVSKLELSGGGFKAHSEGDDGTLVTEGSLPAVFTTDKGINEPRYASLKGIMAAKKKTITETTASALGLQTGTAQVELVSAEHPPARSGGRIIEGATAQEKVSKLVGALRNEAKVL
jgi:electron transfer flavoprotein beta subunit